MVDAESEEEEDISSDEEEEQNEPAQAYLSLMKSLAESAPHKAKRRKLDHASAEETTQPEPEVESSIPVNKDGEQDPDMVVEEAEDDNEDAAPEDLQDDDDDVDAEDPFELKGWIIEERENGLDEKKVMAKVKELGIEKKHKAVLVISEALFTADIVKEIPTYSNMLKAVSTLPFSIFCFRLTLC